MNRIASQLRGKNSGSRASSAMTRTFLLSPALRRWSPRADAPERARAVRARRPPALAETGFVRRGFHFSQRPLFSRQAGLRQCLRAAGSFARARDHPDSWSRSGRNRSHPAPTCGNLPRSTSRRRSRAIGARSSATFDVSLGNSPRTAKLCCSEASRPANTSACCSRSCRSGLPFPADFVGRGDMSRGGLAPALRGRRNRTRLHPGARRGAKRKATAETWNRAATPKCPFRFKPPLPPMEARSVDEIPTGDGWQYEPKWDGFRCLAFRDGRRRFPAVESRPATRALFPGCRERQLGGLKAKQFVLDGELVIPVGGSSLSTSCSCASIPPPAGCKSWPRRIRRFSSSSICSPERDGKSLLRSPLRRASSAGSKNSPAKYFPNEKQIRLSPATTS